MKTRLLTLALVALALFPASMTAAHAASNHAPSYLYTIGLPPLPPIFQGPATAVASDGSKIAMTGIGSFTVEGTARSISGGGNYTLTDAAGNMSSGTWTATHLEGFVSYGTDLSMISQFNLPAGSQGGELHTQITLSGLGSAELVMLCTLGTPPPPNAVDGIRVEVGSKQYRPMPNDGDSLFVVQ